MTERDSLERIRRLYGEILQDAARLYRHRPEVLAGIMQRETEGGTSPLLDKPGPEGRGDLGHGHGLMQIDDRWHKPFIDSGAWSDARQNILYAAEVLAAKRRFIKVKTIGFALTDDQLEHAWIAAYNAGEGRILRLLQLGEDPDLATAHGNYGREVLRLADMYNLLA